MQSLEMLTVPLFDQVLKTRVAMLATMDLRALIRPMLGQFNGLYMPQLPLKFNTHLTAEMA